MNTARVRYEVRGPNGSRNDPHRWQVWDREKECTAYRCPTREQARWVAVDENRKLAIAKRNQGEAR